MQKANVIKNILHIDSGVALKSVTHSQCVSCNTLHLLYHFYHSRYIFRFYVKVKCELLLSRQCQLCCCFRFVLEF